MTLNETVPACDVVRPGDDGYEQAARTFFGAGRPAEVWRPRTSGEVAHAVSYAVRHGLAVSVRSGGHSALGHGTNDDGLVVDLQHLDEVDVLDRAQRLVRVGGGATWGRVAAALDEHGWGISSGDTADVGVGGLTLGGGIGWLVRRSGLAVDSLVGARVVTADGRLVSASAEENPDLFWALRGGGGNFGVVVDFDFVAQEVAAVRYGTVTYELEDATRLVARWRDAMRSAPDELSSTLVLPPRMPGAPPTAMVLLCYAGPEGTLRTVGDDAIAPLLDLGTVTTWNVGERRYREVLEQAAFPPGLRLVARNALVPALDDGLVDAIDRMHRTAPGSAFALRSLGGAFGRVPADATAFAHRDAEAMVVLGLVLPAATPEEDVERGLALWPEVAAFGTGTYVGFQGSAGPADVAAAYPRTTYDRLAAVKRAYDPGNVFARNHNVPPA